MTVNLGRIRPATSPETKFSRQIDALDRERTMFILPIGMLEEHGPHLPIGADTFGVMFEADGVAKRISRPLQRWNVLMMPPLHYGKLRANAGQTFDELQELATKPAWQGYMSAPAKVTAAYGRDIEGWWVDGLSELILRAASGENPLKAPRNPAALDPGRAGVFTKALENERAFEAKFDAWRRRGAVRTSAERRT